MEKFRDHEKEYKQKKPTKAAMLNETEIKGKFNFGSGSSFEGDYDDEENEANGSDDDLNDDLDVSDINLDKEWLAKFTTDTLRIVINKYDAELEKMQNNKKKGGQKKNRDKINALKAKKSHLQQIKDRAEELQISMDYLEPGQIKQLRIQSKQLNQNSDEELVRKNVHQEIDNLINKSETNRTNFNNPMNKGKILGNSDSQSDSRQLVEQLDV